MKRVISERLQSEPLNPIEKEAGGNIERMVVRYSRNRTRTRRRTRVAVSGVLFANQGPNFRTNAGELLMAKGCEGASLAQNRSQVGMKFNLFRNHSQFLNDFSVCRTGTAFVMNRGKAREKHQSTVCRLLVLHIQRGAVVLLTTCGCASHRPAPLLVRHQVPDVGNRTVDGVSLRLLTYNIWGLPSWMTHAPTGRYPRIARELERLDPDIILIQEAWTGKARAAAPTNGNWAVARAAGQHTFFQQCGLMTLSKYPILDGKFYPFSRAAFPDRFVNKGVLKTTVQLPGCLILNIWNVHLQNGGPASIRQSQVQELVSLVTSAQDNQIADVVGGDFNCTPTSPLGRELETALGPSVLQLGNVEPFVTWDGLSSKPGAGETLDYVFIHRRVDMQNLSAAARVAFTPASQKQRLSDHLAVESVVNFSPPKTLADTAGRETVSEAGGSNRSFVEYGVLSRAE